MLVVLPILINAMNLELYLIKQVKILVSKILISKVQKRIVILVERLKSSQLASQY